MNLGISIAKLSIKAACGQLAVYKMYKNDRKFLHLAEKHFQHINPVTVSIFQVLYTNYNMLTSEFWRCLLFPIVYSIYAKLTLPLN